MEALDVDNVDWRLFFYFNFYFSVLTNAKQDSPRFRSQYKECNRV